MSVEITVENMVVQDCSEPYADAIGHIQKLISSEIGECPEGSKDASPLANLHSIDPQKLTLRHGINIQGREGGDIVVDVGEIHEASCMECGDASAKYILLKLWSADGP
jgi:hypothetical protein